MWAESDREIIEDIMDKCYIGDWFVLHLLSRNTNLQIYKRIVKSLANVLRERKSSVSNQVQRYSMERLEVANGVWSLVFFSFLWVFLVLNIYGILKNSKNCTKLDCIMISGSFWKNPWVYFRFFWEFLKWRNTKKNYSVALVLSAA